MSQVITAVFEDGVLKPEKHLDLPARTRVRITVELLEHPNGSIEWAWGELEQLCSLDFHFKEVKERFKKLGL